MTERPNTALILEGGALRGVYTSGVLDVLMLHHVKIPNVGGDFRRFIERPVSMYPGRSAMPRNSI